MLQRRRIAGLRQLQLAVKIVGQIGVIREKDFITKRATRENIDGVRLAAVGRGILRRAAQNQLAALTNGTGIGVGRIHNVVLSVVHGHDIPHVGASAGARRGHIAGHKAALHLVGLEFRQIAQVLESLCIALADNLCIRIAVKNPQQLPGTVLLGIVARIRSSLIVVGQLADFLNIAFDLLVICSIFVLLYNDLRRRGCGACRTGLGGVHFGIVFIKIGSSEGRVNAEAKPVPHPIRSRSIRIFRVSAAGNIPVGLPAPIQIKRLIQQQRLNHRIKLLLKRLLMCCNFCFSICRVQKRKFRAKAKAL